MKVEKINSLVESVSGISMSDEGRLAVNERWLTDGNVSDEVNNALDDISGDVFELQMEFYRSSKHRNALVEPAIELLTRIKDRANAALERIQTSPPEDTNEAQEIKFSEKPSKASFAQIADKRISLGNEEMAKLGKGKLALKVRPNMLPSYKAAAQGLPWLFSIDGLSYYVTNQKDNVLELSPFKLQANASAIISDLMNPQRKEVGKDKLLRMFAGMQKPST